MRSKIDEAVSRPARHDPRREESEPPPPGAGEGAAEPESPPESPRRAEPVTLPPSDEAIDLREIAVPTVPPLAATEPALAPITLGDAPPLAEPPPAEEPPPSAPRGSPSRADDPPRAPAFSITSLDPRLEAIEPAIAKGDWSEIANQLGSDEQAGRLPPNLGLLFALARKESEHDEATARKGTAYNELAIRCMAGLFGVPEQSPIALVLAKRLLRKNPVSWQKRPAPPAKVSILLIILVVAVCGGLTWAITQGYIQFRRVA